MSVSVYILDERNLRWPSMWPSAHMNGCLFTVDAKAAVLRGIGIIGESRGNYFPFTFSVPLICHLLRDISYFCIQISDFYFNTDRVESDDTEMNCFWYRSAICYIYAFTEIKPVNNINLLNVH